MPCSKSSRRCTRSWCPCPAARIWPCGFSRDSPGKSKTGSTTRSPASRLPSVEEIHAGYVEPLLVQLQIDGGETLRRLMESRLGISGNETSIRVLARSMGLTRARVYQLLEEIHSMMQVRWPSARQVAMRMDQWLAHQMAGSQERTAFRRAADLFFPDKLGVPLHDAADDPTLS